MRERIARHIGDWIRFNIVVLAIALTCLREAQGQTNKTTATSGSAQAVGVGSASTATNPADAVRQAQTELERKTWEISGQLVLTGEPESFTGLTPKRPFDPRGGGCGARQLMARYGQLNIDDAAFQGLSNPDMSVSSARASSVGIKWWLNKNVCVMTSFSHTTFDGGGAYNPLDASTLKPPATVSHQDENVSFTRIQLAF